MLEAHQYATHNKESMFSPALGLSSSDSESLSEVSSSKSKYGKNPLTHSYKAVAQLEGGAPLSNFSGDQASSLAGKGCVKGTRKNSKSDDTSKRVTLKLSTGHPNTKSCGTVRLPIPGVVVRQKKVYSPRVDSFVMRFLRRISCVAS